jgi:starch synthase
MYLSADLFRAKAFSILIALYVIYYNIRMRKKLNILFVASEASPFAKEGGLGDMVGALSATLWKMGHNVILVIPRYRRIDRARLGLRQVPGSLGVPIETMGTLWCRVFEGEMPGSGMPAYFVDYQKFYERDGGLYNDPNGNAYKDNDIRYVFLSKAALQLCKMIHFRPDMIHVHDWHTSIIPVFLDTIYKNDPVLGDSATLLTIHNMQYQGNFQKRLMEVLGIGWEHFHYLDLEFYDKVNLLKGGIYHSTLINTVSPTYAKEIQTPEYGWRLDGVVRDRAKDFCGILNGVDYDEWNPGSDTNTAANYSENDLSGKVTCKKDLQKTFGLPTRGGVPLIGMVSRLVYQKGIDALAEAIHQILSYNIQFVLLGSGESWAHSYFRGLPKRYPKKFACYLGYDDALAHKIKAGADFFFMPSHFEPCGLSQMYSLRYGTLPIVRATGGLNDTVEDFNKKTLGGTGFKFTDLTTDTICNTIERAIDTYTTDKEAMETLIRRAMQKRFRWEDSAKRYEELYYLAVRKRIGGEGFRKKIRNKRNIK